MAIRIKGLTKIRDKEKAVKILLEALIDYPLLNKAFPDRGRRIKILESDLWFKVSYGMKFGQAYALNKECHEVIIILPSACRKTSKLKNIIAGGYSSKYKELVSNLTEEEQEEKLSLFSEIMEMEKDIEFPSKYLYISFLGVKEEHQNKDKVLELLNKVLAYGVMKNTPIVLTTSEPKNVNFYQELGFKIMGITSSKKFQFINIYLVKS